MFPPSWDVSGTLRKALGRLRDAPGGSGTSLGRSGRLWDVSGTLQKLWDISGRLQDKFQNIPDGFKHV